MGNGEKVFFWKDVWLGANNLAHKYSQNFQNAVHKDFCVKEAGKWVEGRWCWNLPWRRQWFDWEESLVGQFMSELEGL